MNNDSQFGRVPDAMVPKRRAAALTRVLGSLVGWGMFFALVIGALAFWGWGVFTSDGPLRESKVLVLPEGSSRADIAKLLQDQGVISDARVMNAASFVSGLRGGSLKPGEYEFSAGMPMAGVLNALATGRVVTYKLTIPEGWTTQMALARINANEVLTGDPVAVVPEGAVIADTQVFRRGMTRAKLVEDMQAAQAKLVDEVWSTRPADFILKTKEELVTLASIVEKETGKPEERARVAAVFVNRLKKGMRLQSDPTIIYGIAGGAGKLERAITRADIDGKTPYNTYQIDGLPPGPIAVPGRASLEAVVKPADSQDLYFVADGTGGHAFAATLEQHNANVQAWREGQKAGIELPGQADAAAAAPTDVVEQTPLPDVQAETPKPEVAPEDAAKAEDADKPIEEAAKDATKSQPVPAPAEDAQGETQPAVAAPKPAEPPETPAVKPQQATDTPPLPVEKKPKATVVAEVKTELKPGSIVKVGKKLVPIPTIKKAKP